MIGKKVQAPSIVEKMVESHLRWFVARRCMSEDSASLLKLFS